MSGKKDGRGTGCPRPRPYARRGTVCFPLSVSVKYAIEALLERVAPDWRTRQCERDGGEHHLTVIAPYEQKEMRESAEELARQMGDALEAVEEVCLAPLGLGIANGACAFLVVHSSALESARRSLGLAPNGPFHVTLGFKERDVHSIEKKGLASVVEWWPRAGEAIEADFQSIRSISIKGHQRELLRAVLQISRAASSHATALKAALLLGDKLASDAELEALSATDIVEGHYLRAKHDIGKGTGGSEAAHYALRHIEGASVSPDDVRIMWLSKEARAARVRLAMSADRYMGIKRRTRGSSLSDLRPVDTTAPEGAKGLCLSPARHPPACTPQIKFCNRRGR